MVQSMVRTLLCKAREQRRPRRGLLRDIFAVGKSGGFKLVVFRGCQNYKSPSQQSHRPPRVQQRPHLIPCSSF